MFQFLAGGGRAVTEIRRTLCLYDGSGHHESDLPIDAPMSTLVTFVVVIEDSDLIPEEPRDLRARVGNQRFLLREGEIERVLKEHPQLPLDFLGFLSWADKAQQHIIRIANVAQTALA